MHLQLLPFQGHLNVMALLLDTQVQVTRDELEMILLRQKDDDYAEIELLLKTRQDMPVDEDLINTH